MTYAIQPIATEIAQSILAWCGVTDPTPVEVTAAGLAAEAAQNTIKFYRGLDTEDEFETEYRSLAIEMGVYLYQKRGVDGTTAYGEVGVQRSFEKGSFPPSMLARIKLPITAG